MASAHRVRGDRRTATRSASSRDQAQPQRAILDTFEAEIASTLAKELQKSMCRSNVTDDTTEILYDREVNGYRVILMRGQTPTDSQVNLSPREQEIGRMVAKGYPNKTIAAVLDISTWTVGTHLRRMFAKLGVNSRAAMVAQLMRLQRDDS